MQWPLADITTEDTPQSAAIARQSTAVGVPQSGAIARQSTAAFLFYRIPTTLSFSDTLD